MLKGILPTRYNKHFIKLSQALYLLNKNHIKYEDLAEAANLIDEFAKGFEILYRCYSYWYGGSQVKNGAAGVPCTLCSKKSLRPGVDD